ncbi:MAG TPA: glycerol-3-phosphate acyltransferase, partial [Planctomycetota bacterium]|nr:glycerol-3-phosphate acyltransferase [Planctomycetota bacterium]
GFRGGKGVATASGSIVAIDPVVFVCGGLVWLLLAGTARYVSLASMGMGIAFPIAAQIRWGREGWPLVVGLVALMLLILVRHKPNIVRLMQGTEPKMGSKKGKEGSSRG